MNYFLKFFNKKEENKPEFYQTFQIPWFEENVLTSDLFEAFDEKWFFFSLI
jgi:hypothetical protein